jgi:hypothetical protein
MWAVGVSAFGTIGRELALDDVFFARLDDLGLVRFSGLHWVWLSGFRVLWGWLEGVPSLAGKSL